MATLPRRPSLTLSGLTDSQCCFTDARMRTREGRKSTPCGSVSSCMLLPCEPGDGGRLTPGPKPPGPEGPKSPTTSPPADPPRAAWRMAPDTDVSGTDTRPCPGGRGGGGRLGVSNASLGVSTG